ncbi:MAG: 4-hydroxy-tetrahydrodipicolinate synthase [Bacteroidales bacterium]|jgi:4-hydroxy-tetrahydrodipicolinate synthase|nr:4-hydroxy-tetrahydrodipicolinate synthase [Bacteroidales bacterium]
MASQNHKFSGTGVAMVTPFNADHSIDFDGLARLIDFLLDNKTEYLVLMGTTGENATISKEEKTELLAFVKKQIKGRCPLVYGIGGNNTVEVLNTISQTDFTGVDALLSVSPYYNKPIQEGIYQHFMRIADVSPVPVILYNVPGRTGSNMSAATILRLAYDHKNIIAVKEASGNLDQITEIIRKKPEDFMVISGDDNLSLHMILLGADGVISVVANALPLEYGDLIRYALKGDFIKARENHFRIFDFVNAIFSDGSPGGIKSALKTMKICNDYVRLPLVNVSADTHNYLAKLLKPFGY